MLANNGWHDGLIRSFMTSKTMPIVQPTAVFFDLDETLIQHSQEISVLAAGALRKIDPERAHATLDFNVALKGAAESLWPHIHEYTGRGEQVLGGVLSNALAAIGSEPSPSRRALGPTLCRDAIVRSRSASALTFIGPKLDRAIFA